LFSNSPVRLCCNFRVLHTIVLELSRSTSNSHVRLCCNFHVLHTSCSRTLTFGLELPRSASNSHVRLCPRTLTFGLELPRSAVSSNSHVRPRTPTFGSVLELSRSASNSHVRQCHNFLVLCTLFQNHYSFVTLTSYVCSCTATLTFTVRSERDIPKPEVTKPPAK